MTPVGMGLSVMGNVVRVTGRENFIDPSATYVWAVLDFDGKTFIRHDGAAAEPAK